MNHLFLYLLFKIFHFNSQTLLKFDYSQLISTNKLITQYLKYNGKKQMGYSGQLILFNTLCTQKLNQCYQNYINSPDFEQASLKSEQTSNYPTVQLNLKFNETRCNSFYVALATKCLLYTNRHFLKTSKSCLGHPKMCEFIKNTCLDSFGTNIFILFI